ncbi:diatom-specific cyclin [Seminavis robusta]|uniref:Diatom-specific cyclin n=1 Tax=Seminavis robusta TaxID=568900 RepID=A0A9N8DQI2_9STRA|nr:diatom-specific cyclin [Seminavis robusta]|eukprot:Sro299_g111490.1 diatom-specific cyclin (306) ;mRNA; f:65500-66417
MTPTSATVEIIECMVRQEAFYHPPGMDEDPTSERFSPVGVESRGRMLNFFYDLLGKIGSSRETAEIAVSYLDRFLATPGLGNQALCNKKLFQLVSTTCLYTAVKVHEVQAMTPKLMADLSHGVFTAEEVEEMEMILVQALKWRLNPPTSLAFVRQFLDLVPAKAMTREMKRTAYDLARHQTELAHEDPRLFCEKKSLVAYMAVQNTLEQLDVPFNLADSVGVLLLGTHSTQEMSSYRYGSLQSMMQLRLTSKLGRFLPSFMSFPSSTAPSSIRKRSASWLSTPIQQYDESPRSVHNNALAEPSKA